MAEMTCTGWTTPYPLANPQGRRAQPRPGVLRLARALGVERRAVEHALDRAHHLEALRKLTLAELSAPPLRPGDAERIFYLVQWERLQAHLETYGELPEPAELTPLLETLTPIFERHFSRSTRLNETLLELYRGAFADVQPDSPSKVPACTQFLKEVWQRFISSSSRTQRSRSLHPENA